MKLKIIKILNKILTRLNKIKVKNKYTKEDLENELEIFKNNIRK